MKEILVINNLVWVILVHIFSSPVRETEFTLICWELCCLTVPPTFLWIVLTLAEISSLDEWEFWYGRTRGRSLGMTLVGGHRQRTRGEWGKGQSKDGERAKDGSHGNLVFFVWWERGEDKSAFSLLIAGIWRHWKPPALLQGSTSESLTFTEVMFFKLFWKCEKSLWLLFIRYPKLRKILPREELK